VGYRGVDSADSGRGRWVCLGSGETRGTLVVVVALWTFICCKSCYLLKIMLYTLANSLHRRNSVKLDKWNYMALL
jgi:hypothetical protein